jgi:hypothetical protein
MLTVRLVLIRCRVLIFRRAWTDREDEAIRHMVAKHGTKSWALIAENLAKEGMPGRSGKQCRERWHNHLGRCELCLQNDFNLHDYC